MALLLASCILLSMATLAHSAAPPYGQLRVSGTRMLGSNGAEVALHGMSLFWSQWGEGAPFYNRDTVEALKCSWNANLVRAAMGVNEGGTGYLTNPSAEMAKVEAVIQAAIDLGIYVIVDWHDHNAQQNVDQAVQFFTQIAQRYGNQPHIIYEIFNEPLGVDWNGVLRPYHERVVATIRAVDADNIIVLGTPNWSQDVDVAANNPVQGSNLMYTLHYYAATHRAELRNKMQTAMSRGVAVFVTEYGVVSADGGGGVDSASAQEWWTFLDNNRISYANWALDNKAEGSAALQPGTGATLAQVGDDNRLTASGRLVKDKLRSQNNGVSCSASAATTTTVRPVTTTTRAAAATTTRAAATTTRAAATTTRAATTTTRAAAGGGGVASGSGVSVSFRTVNTWNGGGQYSLVFRNTGSVPLCGVTFRMVFPSGLSMTSSWNFSWLTGTQYVLPDWVNIQPGQTFESAGVVFSGGSSVPTLGIVRARNC